MNIYTDKISALIHESAYPAADGTALHRGQVVVLSENAVRPAAVQQAEAILGVCLESLEASHPCGARVRVADSPSTIFICDAPQITVTSATTSSISATELAAFADDAFNSGVLKLVSTGPSSTNSGKPGTLYTISDYSATGKTFTLGSTLDTAAAAGDIYQIFPPIGASLGALNNTLDGIVLTAAANNFALRVVGWDTQAGKLLLMANVHIYGSKNA